MSDSDLAATRRALREILNDEPPPPMLRSAFDQLSPAKQAAFCKLGGRIIPDPKPDRCTAPTFTDGRRPATASRAEFNAMNALDRATYCALGLPLRD
jgi:hypothetical protein